ncbi:hypothetical protein [Halopseudomonas salina]|uniref:Uncharacterized protein n=1 Tax=Halopseudomonas salina TaxID=1323744 RepID=A0ABQ1NY75_9GAMM|nr:hypothetical protein [Halopseudomonas salina]GGC87173.1 hypothetical protein GCM10007418_03700 [Halopseudomonas salina]
MYLQEIVIGIALIICVLAYLFGITTGRMQQSKLCAEKLERFRKLIFSERRRAHEAEQAVINQAAEAKWLAAQLRHQMPRTAHTKYALRMAAKELALASQTFGAMKSAHSQTAKQLSEELIRIASSMDPDPAPAAANDTAPHLGLEDAA